MVAPEIADIALEGPPKLTRSFRRLWWAAGISASGDGLVVVAIPLLAVSITRSPLLIAGVTAANRASAALAALPGGVLADRVNRRWLMVACNVIAGLMLAGLVAAMSFSRADLPMLYAVSVVLAASDVIYELAAQAYVPTLVDDRVLPKANSRLQVMTGSGEQFAGPAVGGVLFSVARRVPFVADAISFFASALLVGTTRSPLSGTTWLPSGTAKDAPGRRAPRETSWAEDFRQGFRWFKRERSVQLVAAVVSSVVFAQFMVLGIMVVYGTRTLHLSSTGYGLYFASASLLGVLTGFWAHQVTHRLGAGKAIVWGFGLLVASYVGLGFTKSVVLAVFAFGLQDVGTVIANVGAITARQRLIPTHLYGRVVSIHRLAVAGSMPLGALLGGVIAGVAGTSVAFVMAGGLVLAFLAILGPALQNSLSTLRP